MILHRVSPMSDAGAQVILHDPARLAVLHATGVFDTPAEEVFDRHTRLARRLLHSTAAFLTLVDDSWVFFKSAAAPPGAKLPVRLAIADSVCPYAVVGGAPMQVNDTRLDPRFRDHSVVKDFALVAYAGVPLFVEQHALGTFCVIDDKPRAWSSDDLEILSDLAAAIGSEIGLRLHAQRQSQVEAGLRASVKRFAAAFHANPMPMAITALDGRYLEINDAMLAHAGYTRDEMVGATASVFDSFVDVEERVAYYRALALEGSVQRFAARLRVKSGAVRDCLLTAERFESDGEERILKVRIDITGRHRRENNAQFLANLQNELARLTSADDFVRLAGNCITAHFGLAHCLFLEINEAADEATVFYDNCKPDLRDLSGRYAITAFHTAEEKQQLILGRTVVIDDVRDGARAERAAAQFKSLGVCSLITAPYVSEGRWRFALSAQRDKPHRWREDEVELLHTLATSIYPRLEHTRAEAALRAAHHSFRHLVQNSPFGVYAVDADFRLALVSAGARKVFENVHPIIGRDLAQVLRSMWPEPFASEAIGRFRHTLETGESYHAPGTIERRHDSGQVESYDWKIERVMLPDGRLGVVCHFYDLSERERYVTLLREMDKRKNEFLAMLSHELRSPLAPIRNAAELLHRHGDTTAPLRNATEVLVRQTTHLVRLVDDLLDISRVTQGKVVLVTAPASFAQAVLAGVELARPLIDARRQHLTFVHPDEPLYVKGDAARLTQVVGNLLSNAAKYTDPGGTITLALASEAGRARLTVTDNGVGIAADFLPRVFDPFMQAECSLDRAQGGLGIGLSLVKRLVEMHGGEVTASSEVGHGSSFTVVLPLCAAPSAEVSAAPATESIQTKRVLLVDDNVDSAESMGKLLELEGYTVAYAHDGNAALTAAARFHPEVCLLDIGLPGMDGYTLARKLHAMPETQSAVYIALTGYGQADDRARSKDAGFHHHLVKPAEPKQLLALLAQVPSTNVSV